MICFYHHCNVIGLVLSDGNDMTGLEELLIASASAFSVGGLSAFKIQNKFPYTFFSTIAENCFKGIRIHLEV